MEGHSGLPEIAIGGTELPPAYRHAVGIGRIDAHRSFVGGITGDILARRVYIHLVANTVRRGDRRGGQIPAQPAGEDDYQGPPP